MRSSPAAMLRRWFGRRSSGEPSAPPVWPTLPSGLRIYAIGDVHGRADLLGSMFERIDRHLGDEPAGTSVEIMLGDCIDRGLQSRRVLDLLVARKGARNSLAILGNHEHMMLEALERPDAMATWLANGGRETLFSYGLDVSHPRLAHPRELREEALRAVPEDHLGWLAGLPPFIALGGFAFVHAGVRSGVALQDQLLEDLLWIRDPFLGSESDFGAIVVHGHTPVREPHIRPNRVNIDTAAYLTGRLTCLVLEGARRTFLQVTAREATDRNGTASDGRTVASPATVVLKGH